MGRRRTKSLPLLLCFAMPPRHPVFQPRRILHTEMCSQHQKKRNVWSGGWEGLSDATFPPPHRWVVTSLCWEMWFFLMFPKPPWSRGLNPCKASRQNPPEVVSRRQGFAVDLVQRWKKPLLPCFKLPSLGLSGPYLLMIVLLLANTSTNCISKYWLQHWLLLQTHVYPRLSNPARSQGCSKEGHPKRA